MSDHDVMTYTTDELRAVADDHEDVPLAAYALRDAAAEIDRVRDYTAREIACLENRIRRIEIDRDKHVARLERQIFDILAELADAHHENRRLRGEG